MRIALALPVSDTAIADAVRQKIPGLEVVRETPYFNRTVLTALIQLAPSVVLIGEDLPGDEGDIDLLQFVLGLRKHNVRVILLSHSRKAGDHFLSDMVALGVTDLVVGGEVRLSYLERMIREQTPWSEVSHLLVAGRRPNVQEPELDPIQAPPPPPPKKEGSRRSAAPPPPPVASVAGPTVPTAPATAPPTAPAVASMEPAPNVPPAAPPEPQPEPVPVHVPPAPPPKSVTVVVGLGPEGTGVTTVAVSLAAALAAADSSVALVDLDPVHTAVGVHLQIPSDYSGLRLFLEGAGPEESAAEVFGINVFNAPGFPGEPPAARLKEVDVIRLLDRLKGAHDQVVIDAGHRIDHPATRAAMQLAEEILVVTDLDPYRIEVAAFRWQTLATLTQLDKCRLVINKVVDEAKEVTDKTVAQAFDGEPEVAMRLPLVPQATDAVAKGKPIPLFVGGEHPYAKAMQQMAQPPQRKAGGWSIFRR